MTIVAKGGSGVEVYQVGRSRPPRLRFPKLYVLAIKTIGKKQGNLKWESSFKLLTFRVYPWKQMQLT